MTDIGLKALRKRAGITQRQLGAALFCSHNKIHEIERGEGSFIDEGLWPVMAATLQAEVVEIQRIACAHALAALRREHFVLKLNIGALEKRLQTMQDSLDAWEEP